MKKLLAALLSGSILFGISACGTEFIVPEPTSTNNISAINATVDVAEEDVMSPSAGQLLTEVAAQDKTYQNPILSPARGDGEQFGDPFVMRYNGKYYLYHTASTLNCWESEDLVNWTYVGVCTDNDFFRGSWAPEVRYYNGLFYMTTTGPDGDGDFILTSESPTGPFDAAASYINTNFDTTIFVDDEGDWYMYFPYSGDTIRGLKMSSTLTPEHFTLTDLGLNVGEGAWTEGPMVIKHKDTYFMTYCGGGVIGPGYQIHYATSTGDMLNFVPGENNPLIINTDITTYPGLGHSSLVTGPNLDSLYKVYHSMPWREQPRTMMIDPLYINGDYMQAMGPTLSTQQAPDMPDIYSRFDSEESLTGWTVLNAEIVDSQLKLSEGGVVISEKGIEGDFTAEYNFLAIEDVYAEGAFIPSCGKVAAIFDYTDANNYGAAYINGEGQILEVVFTVDGKETSYKEYLHASFDDSFDFSKLQKLTVKKYGSKYRFLFNDITVCEYESELTGGAIGVSCISGAAKIGFVGIEGDVWHSSYKELYKPVEGEFGALLCIENELNIAEYDDREYLSVKGGETYNYYINAEASCNYDLAIKYRSKEVLSTFELYYNGELIAEGALPASDSLRTEVLRGLEIPQGYGVFTLKMTSGSADIFNYEFITSSNLTESVAIDLSAPLYSEGEWSIVNGEFSSVNTAAKFLYGDREWSNYSVSATFTPNSDFITANFIFRATNESLTPEYSFTECQSFYLGYSVSIVNSDGESYVVLYKQNYGKKELARFNMDIPLDRPINVMVEAVDENILVYVDGQCVIEYSDPDPYLKGAVGFSNIPTANVSGLNVQPLYS